MTPHRAFYVKKRMILMCDFDRAGFVAPEMTKCRRVVVLRAFGTIALVVPLSATAPRFVRPYHAPIEAKLYQSLTARVWAKCDAITHVSIRRLMPVAARVALRS